MANLNLTNLAQSAQNSHTTIVLSTGEWVIVPGGADPDAFRCYCEAKIKLAANPCKRQRAFVRSSKPSKRTNYAERVMAAVADEDTFAGGIEWDIPFCGEPCPYDDEADDYGLQSAW